MKKSNSFSTINTSLYLLLISCAVTFLSCGPPSAVPSVVLTDPNTATFLSVDSRESGACNIPGTSQINRSPLFGIGPSISIRQPFAGYESIWIPGSPPFSCDRLFIAKTNGVFNFDLTNFLATRTLGNIHYAVVEIVEFTPAGNPVRIQIAQPWDANLYSIPVNPIQDFKEFELKKVTGFWTPRTELNTISGRMPSITDLQDLNSERNIFRISSDPHAGAGLIGQTQFVVTDEIRLQATGIINREANNFFGFVIIPKNIPPYNSNCHATGSFRVQLRIYLR